jgi:hypothetical protein
MNDSWTVWALSKVFRFTEDIIEESLNSRYEKKRFFWKDRIGVAAIPCPLFKMQQNLIY